MSAVGGVAKGAMKMATAAVGVASAAVGKFGYDSVQAGMEFDSSMSQVAATMGKTTQELKEEIVSVDGFTGNLIDFAQQMGSTTAFSASQAADALNYMALAGYDAETSVKMLPNVLNLAAAGGMELATASDMVTDAQTALGLSLDETSTMVDQMAKASSKSNTSVAQLGEAFLTVGGNAKDLGGGTAELSQVLGVLADNGIKGAEAGTHLRNIMLAMNPTTDKAAAAWNELGVEAYDAQGNLKPMEQIFYQLSNAMADMTDQQKTQILSDMFNKTDLAAVNALLDTQAERYQELKEEINGAWYTQNGLTKSMEENGLSMEAMQNNLMALGLSADDFKSSLDFAEGGVQDFIANIEECVDASVSEQQIIQALGGDVDALQKSFDEAGGAAGAMAETQLDNLQGDITLFKSALEGAQIAVSNGLTPTLREFVQFGSKGLSEITQAFNENGIEGAMEKFGELLSEGLNMLIEMVPKVIEAGVKLLSALIQGIVENLPTLIEAVMSIIMTLVDAIVTNVPILLDAVINILFMLVNAIMDNYAIILDAGVGLLMTLVQGISENLPKMIPTVVDVLLTIVETLIDNLPMIIEAAITLIIALAEGIIEAIPILVDHIPPLIEAIVKALINLFPVIKNGVYTIILKLVEALLTLWKSVVNVIPKLIKMIKDVFVNTDWKSLGKNIIEGMTKGLKENFTKILNLVKDMAGSVLSTFKNIFGIHSPSKEFEWIGKMCVAGFEEPLEDMSLDGVTDNINASISTMEAGIAGANFSATGNINGVMDTNVQVVLEGDAAGVFRLVRQQNRKMIKSGGYNPLMA